MKSGWQARIGPAEERLDPCIKKRSAGREAGLHGFLPSQPSCFLFDFLPINFAPRTQPVKVDKPLQRKQSMPRGVHSKVKKLPVLA